MTEPIRQVALLRGINVGGHRMIKKEELTEIFTGAGLTDVVTLLASGNVLFSSPEPNESKLQATIEAALFKALEYEVDVMVRTVAYMKELIEMNPFTPYKPEGNKFYVAFLSELPGEVPDLPKNLPEQGAVAVAMYERELFAISKKGPDGRYGDFSKFLVKSFGEQPITTRNWNTVVKLASNGQ